jgi:hypothetical protein
MNNIVIPIVRSTGMPTLDWLNENVVYSEITCIDYFVEHGILRIPMNCSRCGRNVTSMSGSLKNYQCNHKDCRKYQSLYSNTVFFRSRTKIHEIMKMAYYWLCGDSWTSILAKTGLSRKAVTSWINYCIGI